MRIHRVLVAAAAVVIAAAIPSAALAGPGGGTTAPGGLIVFLRITDPADTLTVSPDGTSLRATGCGGDRTRSGAPRRVLRVEPSGVTFLAYTEAVALQPRAVVRIVSRDEACGDPAVLAELPSGLDVIGATWSPDGRRVAFGALRYDPTGQLLDQGVWVGEVVGTGSAATLTGIHLAVSLPMTPVVGQPAGTLVAYYLHAVTPRWSSDGHRVVVSHRTRPEVSSTDSGIFVGELGLTGDTGVRAGARVMVSGSAWQPSFSPLAGDDRIAFVQTAGTQSCFRNAIFVTTSAGGSSTRVTTGICQLGDPAWSPDGLWFAYDAWSGSLSEQQSIWRIRADGSGKAVQVAASRTAIYRIPIWVR